MPKPNSELPRSSRIGIIGAMDAEISEFLTHAEIVDRQDWHGFIFYTVRLQGQEAILVKCGVGKVFAAMVSQHLIDVFQPDAIIFTGVAGALNPDYAIGDVVIGRECLQHDVDGIALGFSRGRLLYTDLHIFAGDRLMLEAALGAQLESHTIHAGRILTGDQFMTRSEINHHRYLLDELAGDAVEMEGAALAQVCAVNGIPCLVVRTISDRADGDAVEDFTRFLPVVAHNSFAVVRQILSAWSRAFLDRE